MRDLHKNRSGLDMDYDIVLNICDMFDAYLINEEHGTEYLIVESNRFHREIVQLFEEDDKI